jgi:xanthine dehydrogenase accessory factor
MDRASDILDIIAGRKSAGEPFALATVVRTVAATAAKAGAKAVILPDGTISEGWIGGGCARAAVLKAARDALADGKSRLVSVQPPEELEGQGHKPGEEQDGVRFAKNMCPSQGTMDIFVEPVLPHPSLIILGASPVAISLAEQARRFGFHVTLAAPAADLPDVPETDMLIDGYRLDHLHQARRFVVVSTQGRGDEAALHAATSVDGAYHAFVGSRRKMAALREKLIREGVDATALDRIKAPAGLDLGAITPEEIAMSILAEITLQRRRGQRGEAPVAPESKQAMK